MHGSDLRRVAEPPLRRFARSLRHQRRGVQEDRLHGSRSEVRASRQPSPAFAVQPAFAAVRLSLRRLHESAECRFAEVEDGRGPHQRPCAHLHVRRVGRRCALASRMVGQPRCLASRRAPVAGRGEGGTLHPDTQMAQPPEKMLVRKQLARSEAPGLDPRRLHAAPRLRCLRRDAIRPRLRRAARHRRETPVARRLQPRRQNRHAGCRRLDRRKARVLLGERRQMEVRRCL